MFSGIVEALGRVREASASPAGKRVWIEAPFDRLAIGESICVSGVCLTVAAVPPGLFAADVSPETLRRSTLARLDAGAEVNLEQSLRLGDRLGGHLVFGHVDGVGRLIALRPEGESYLYEFEAPPSVSRYLVEKGSVAVDGVSLTVFGCEDGRFSVAVIPHTAQVTTLGKLAPGDAVNLESDMIAKYVEKLASPYRK
ncbi:MAG TPA: riboflavin synthase [Candidatus Binatia bacterium]|nr:riboflavin synthase [Candidatus Binatia bacterium]